MISYLHQPSSDPSLIDVNQNRRMLFPNSNTNARELQMFYCVSMGLVGLGLTAGRENVIYQHSASYIPPELPVL